MALTLQMSAGNDNAIIFVFEIKRDDQTYFLSTLDITLSGQDYDGQVIKMFGVSDLERGISLSNGGGVGEVGGFFLELSAKTENANFNGFFNEWFPQTSRYLDNAQVKVGMIWDNATTKTEITWLHLYRVDQIDYGVSYNLTCVEFDEFEKKNLPPYKIQKSFNNEISYFPDTIKDSLGDVVPIVYGKFPQTINADIRGFDFVCSPIIPLDTLKAKFALACHKLNQIAVSQLHKYFSTINGYFLLEGEVKASPFTNVEVISNSVGNATATLLDSGGVVRASGFIHPKSNAGDFNIIGSYPIGFPTGTISPSDVDNNIMDRDLDTSFTLAVNEEIHLAFDTEGLDSTIQEREIEPTLKVSCQSIDDVSSLLIRIVDGVISAPNSVWSNEFPSPIGFLREKTFTVLVGQDFHVDEVMRGQVLQDTLSFGIYMKNTGAKVINIFEVFWFVPEIQIGDVIRLSRKRLFPVNNYDTQAEQQEQDYIGRTGRF